MIACAGHNAVKRAAHISCLLIQVASIRLFLLLIAADKAGFEDEFTSILVGLAASVHRERGSGHSLGVGNESRPTKALRRS